MPRFYIQRIYLLKHLEYWNAYYRMMWAWHLGNYIVSNCAHVVFEFGTVEIISLYIVSLLEIVLDSWPNLRLMCYCAIFHHKITCFV